MKQLILSMSILAATFSVGATQVQAQAPGVGVAAPAPHAGMSASQRKAIVAELEARWSSGLSATDRFSPKVARLALKADEANLLAAAEMPTFQAMMGALQGQPLDGDAMVKAIAAGGSGTQALGSPIADTTFTPLPNGRCRVADSRVINLPTVPATVRPIDVEDIGSYAAQGGDGSSVGDGSTNCGIPSFATALVVSATVLPIGQDGFFKVFENGKAFSEGNTVLYTGTVGASNDIIVRSCQTCVDELSVYSNTSTHYVLDVIGYFMPNQATALQCVTTADTSVTVAGNGTGNAIAPVCAAGYTQTATNCESTSWQMPFVYQSAGTCSARNNSGTSATLRANRTCCRVPGR